MHHVEPPWRARSHRPRPLDTKPMPSVGSASIEPITINDDAGIVKCDVCKGKSGCEMASLLWFGKQVCTLCFNMNYSMQLLKQGELEGQGFELNAVLASVLNNRWDRLRVVVKKSGPNNFQSLALYDGEMMPAKS